MATAPANELGEASLMNQLPAVPEDDQPEAAPGVSTDVARCGSPVEAS